MKFIIYALLIYLAYVVFFKSKKSSKLGQAESSSKSDDGIELKQCQSCQTFTQSLVLHNGKLICNECLESKK